MKEAKRFLVWKAYMRTADAPYRRIGDRRYGFAIQHRSKGRQWDWPSMMALIGRQAVAVETFYDRHYRERVVQVFIGPRALVAGHVKKEKPTRER